MFDGQKVYTESLELKTPGNPNVHQKTNN